MRLYHTINFLSDLSCFLFYKMFTTMNDNDKSTTLNRYYVSTVFFEGKKVNLLLMLGMMMMMMTR